MTSAIDIVHATLDDPAATMGDLCKAALRTMLIAELEEPGKYGMNGLPQAIAGAARVAEAEATAAGGQDGMTELLEALRGPTPG